MTENSAAVHLGRRCILVTGMHRSGTSAAARVINLLGAKLSDQLVGADDGNPLGHWEPARVVELNDRLLNDLSYGWDDVSAIDWNGVSAEWLAAAVTSACDVLQADYPTAAFFTIKDPRLSRLLPVWRAAFERLGIAPLIIHCLRNPIEVAQSLKSRDGMASSYGLLLWARYVLDCQIHCHGLPHAVLAYDDLLEDWRAAIAGIEAPLGLSLPVSPDAAAEIGAFLTPNMRHHRHGAGDTAGDLPAAVAAVFDHARGPQAGGSPQALRDLSDRLDAAGADPAILRAEIAARARRARRMRLETVELRGYIAAIQPEVEELRALISRQARSETPPETAIAQTALTEIRDDVRSQIDALSGQVSKSLGDIEQGVASIGSRIDRLQRTEDDHRVEIRNHQDRIALAVEGLSRSYGETADTTERIKTLAVGFDALNRQVTKALGAIEQGVESIESRVDRLQRTEVEHRTEVRNHQDRAIMLVEALSRAQGELADATARNETLAAHCDALHADLAAAQQERDAALARAADFESSREELETLRQSFNELLGGHGSLRRDLETTRAALAAAERRVGQLTADLNSAATAAATALDRPATFGMGLGWRRLASPGPAEGEDGRTADRGTETP